METFVYDMIQDAFLEHPHYHQHDESMIHQLSKNKHLKSTTCEYIMFKNVIFKILYHILKKTHVIFHVNFWWMEFIMIRSAAGRMNQTPCYTTYQ